MSTSTSGTEPSVGLGGRRLSSHSASSGHAKGAGIAVVGVTGVKVICVIFGRVDLDGEVEAEGSPRVDRLAGPPRGRQRPPRQGLERLSGERRDRVALAPDHQHFAGRVHVNRGEEAGRRSWRR